MPRTRFASSLLALAASTVLMVSGSATLPAAADPPVTQQAVLVKDKSPYELSYSEHMDHIRQGDEVCYGPVDSACSKIPPDHGKVRFSVKMYRLKEQERRFDYYFVDVTSNTYGRHGDGDKGRMSITIDPTSRVNLTSNVYSSTRARDDCHSYPLNLGLSMGPVGVGTTVASFSTCDKAQLHTTRLASSAARYDIYSLNRFRTWSVQKWVRVASGAKPSFRVKVSWRADDCTVIRKSFKAYANVKTKSRTIGISAP